MKNIQKRKRLIFVGAAFVISVSALLFIINNFRDNIVFFYSPKELKQQKILQKISNKQIRVGGLVASGSVKKINSLVTEFVITDMEEELTIEHKGMVPDLFRDKQGVVAKGKFDAQENKFFSNEMLIKHDENYMPPEVKKAVEKSLNSTAEIQAK